LGAIGGAKALALLEKMMKDEQSEVCCQVATSLGIIGGKQAAGILSQWIQESLATGNFRTREAILKALIQADKERAFGILEKLAADQDANLRQDAAEGLGALGGENSIALLQQLADDPEDGVRYAVAHQITVVWGEKAWGVLGKLSTDLYTSVRGTIAWKLGLIGGDQAVALLDKMMQDQDEGVLRAVFFALGDIEGEKSFALLERGALSLDEKTRSFAVEGMGVRHSPKTAAWFHELGISDPSAEVRNTVGRILWECHDEQTLETLLEMAKDVDGDVRACVVTSLVHYNGEKVEATLAKMIHDENQYVREALASDLGYNPTEKNLALLETLVTDPEMRVRLHLAWLGVLYIDKEKALGILGKLMKDKDDLVRQQVVSTLGDFSGTQAMKILIQALPVETDRAVEQQILRVLGAFKDFPEAQEAIKNHTPLPEPEPEPVAP